MIPLCHPYVTNEMRIAVYHTLKTRYIGQGPRVDEFEKDFQRFGGYPVAVGSGTDALHIAYIMAGIRPGDEVLTPVFTCSAANQTLLHMGAELVFVDIDEQLNPDPIDIARKITKSTKAIVTVDYAGLPANYSAIRGLAEKYRIPIIEDSAHAPGAMWGDKVVGSFSDFTTFSFQAIKHITTGDGGMVVCQKEDDARKAKLLRWFGLDREKKLKDMHHWEGDISINGYKYQMTDIAASMGIESLKELDNQLVYRKKLVDKYRELLPSSILLDVPTDRTSANWLMTVLVERREELMAHLEQKGIEVSPLHYRNDRYTILRQFKNYCPNMDMLEHKILCLPLNMQVTEDEVEFISNEIKTFYETK